MTTRLLFALVLTLACATNAFVQQATALDLWKQGKPAFGVFVPNAAYTKEAGEKLAENPLYDFLFLNLEPKYDAGAIKAIVAGVRNRKTLIVRIPTVDADGLEAARRRIKEALSLGADGVTVPHIRGVNEANQILGFFREARVNVWSPSNPKGDKIAMLMLEDPDAVAHAAEIADLKGYSILACGIGSLTQALGGNREGAEAGVEKVLAESKRAKLVNMLTASTRDVEQRVRQGFLALLALGQNPDEVIKAGRAAAGRQNR